RAAAAAASAAVVSPASVRSAVWANPVVSPRTTRMPAPRSSPDVRSSIRPSSSRAELLRLSSTNTSAKSPPVRSAVPRTRRTRDSSIIVVSYRGACRTWPGRVDRAEGRAGGHGRVAAIGRRADARHPEAGRPGRGGDSGRDPRPPRTRDDDGGHAGPARPPDTDAGRRDREGRRDRRAGRGPPADVHVLGDEQPRPGQRRPRRTGRRQPRPLHREGALTAGAY